MANVIIDRRKNPGGKNTPNRQKFVNRVKGQIQQNIKNNLPDRDITDSTTGGNIKIKRKTVHEPELRGNPETGERDFVLPGNKEYIVGDKIPKGGGGGGAGGKNASDSGDAQDDFDFAISNDEYIDLFFEDLELPNMTKKEQRKVEHFERQRSGFSNEGNPAQLNLVQSMRNSVGRRIALKFPKKKRIAKLEEMLEKETDEKVRLEILEKIERLRKRHDNIPFIDPVDLRFNNYTNIPKPTSQAVIFFVMDVSASMTEFHKEMAKRFFILLNLFITRKYKRVDTIFIRHHHDAIECDEEEFFYGRESGGTNVSTAYTLVKEALKTRYSPEAWNVYVAQATDGDNFSTDNDKLFAMLEEDIIPSIQYLSYLHVHDDDSPFQRGHSSINQQLTDKMEDLSQRSDNVVVKIAHDAVEVFKAFREMFKAEK